MRRAAFFALAWLLLAASGCSHTSPLVKYKAAGYRQHKNTIWLKVHWNILRPGPDTVVAEGFVEPFNYNTGLHSVSLELVGLDDDGKAVNRAPGRVQDIYILSPVCPASPFRITMKPNGREEEFTVIGTYYHYPAGGRPDFGSTSLDSIPVQSDDQL